MKSWTRIVRDRNLAILLSGQLVSTLGDWLYQIALLVATYQYSGGNSVAVSVLWILRLVPGIALGTVAGAFADRVGHRQAMILADGGRMVIIGTLALILRPSDWLVIYPFAFLAASLYRVVIPASVGLVPLLAESPEDRLAANAAWMQISAFSMIAGSALGGVGAGVGAIRLLLFLQAGTFGVSVVSLWFIKPRVPEAERPQEGDAPDDMAGGFLAIIRGIARRPVLLFMASAVAPVSLVSGALIVWFVPYSQHALHLGSSGVGYLYASMGIGSVAGGFVATWLGLRVPLERVLALGSVVTGISVILFGLTGIALIALAAILVVGISDTLTSVAYDTLLQQVVPEHSIGRIAGTLSSFFVNMMVIGSAASGVLAHVPGVTVSLVLFGALCLIGAGASWAYLQRLTAGKPTVQALARMPVFASVPQSVLEWATRRLASEHAVPGDVIVRQGAVGDRLYIVGAGRVEVSVAEHDRAMTRMIGPGGYFGEIALLHHLPRTATVRALEPVTLWVLSQDDFRELQERATSIRRTVLETAWERLGEIAAFRMASAR